MDDTLDSNQPVNQTPVQQKAIPVVPTTGPVKNKVVPPWVASSGQPVKESASGATPSVSAPLVETEEISAQEGLVVKKSPFRKLFPLVILLALGVGLLFLITKVILPLVKKSEKEGSDEIDKDEKITLTYWGLWEAKEAINPVIDEYQRNHPHITINYSQQSYKDYRERLQSALARGEGPDVFRFHNTWLAMLKEELEPAPSETCQLINLEENFYPVANEDLKVDSQIFGVPLTFDALALFYNSKLLKEAGKTPPSTWDEFQRTAKDLCVADSEDKSCGPGAKIVTAGAALGTASNVDHFSDILGLMMLQNGADLAKPNGASAEDALKFYTLFTITDHIWDESLPSSVYAFATEKVAMIFAPSWRAHEIAQINPELEFKISSVPQLPGAQVSWATYWVEGVSSKSKNIQAAWDFLSYLSSKEALTQFYNQTTLLRDFGEPYSRKDLASQLEDDPFVGAFVKQGPYAKSWYLCSATHDNGINDKMIKYFEDAVNKVLKGESAAKALETTSQGVARVLNQYKIK